MKSFANFSFLFDVLSQVSQRPTSSWSTRRIIFFILVFPFLAGNWSCAAKKNLEEKKVVYQDNKIIPENILEEAKTALSFYPELKDVEIEFKYQKGIKKSFMQAQPKITKLFNGKKDRSYYVLMSSKFLIQDEEFSITEIPSEVLIGWLGHELGHIVDYRDKSAMKLLKFGTRYVTSDKFIKKAERTADTHAINRGLGKYIFATKDFILNHSTLSDAYKRRKARLYLSPAEILALVNDLEEEVPEEIEEGES
ncbi:hypothetical protein ACXYMT_07170 [Salinimicrobium sp. CAU 1759]